MAKQQVVQFDNGATLIYQKQSVFNGYSFIIGFMSGAQLDGKYKGLSHLLEHLMFRTSSSRNVKKNVLRDVLRYSINQNAATTQYYISSDFSVTHNNVRFALQNCMKMFLTKSFSEEQIAKEIEIVKQEIKYHSGSSSFEEPSAFSTLMSSLATSQDSLMADDILGNAHTLNQITPKILKKYVERYFTTDNLVISVTSNQSLEKVIELINDEIFSVVPEAKSTKYIVPLPEPTQFHPVNVSYFNPRASHNVDIDLILRERIDESEDVDKEYAFNIVEEYLMNSIGGVLWNVLREDNNLVYTYSLTNLDYGTSKFKVFNAITSAAKMRKTVREICTTIRNIGLYGAPKEKFELVKQALTDQQNASLQKFKSCSARSNFDQFLEGIPFVDYKKVFNYIQNMTYEEFNQYVMPIYQAAQVSLAVDGAFDTRKMYNLIEVEELLGNFSHSQYWHELNQPVAHTTPIPDPQFEMIEQFQQQVLQEQALQQQLDDFAREINRDVLTIDNEKIK